MTKKNKISMYRQPVILCSLCIFLFTVPVLFAQQQAGRQTTAAYEMEMLLNASEITYGQAARFILEASDTAVFTNTDEAFRYLTENNWVSEKISADQTARLDVVSGIFMKAFDLKGGIFYTLTGQPHYAYRELVYRSHIQGKTEPGTKVSGEMLLFITSRILSVNQTGAAQ